MFVDHVGTNTASQRCVVAIDESVSERFPRVVGPSLNHADILPNPAGPRWPLEAAF